MKKIIFIITLAFIVYSEGVKAQTDTLSILQNIITNKANYIGQPFSVLLNQLSLEIKYFSPSRANSNNRYKEPSTQFSFYFPWNPGELYRTRPCLRIYWQPYLNRTTSMSLFSQAKGAWSSAVASHYTSQIIQNIILEKR